MRRVGQRFQEIFEHENGFRFHATLQPIRDMKIYSDDYFPIRQILRVYSSSNVHAGDVIQNKLGERFLLGEYDKRDIYTGFRCYPVNMQVRWEREMSNLDPLTGLPKGTGRTLLGMIWVLSEIVSREERGSHIKTKEDVKRVLTGADVQLNDYLDGEKIVKLNPALGIKQLEVV